MISHLLRLSASGGLSARPVRRWRVKVRDKVLQLHPFRLRSGASSTFATLGSILPTYRGRPPSSYNLDKASSSESLSTSLSEYNLPVPFSLFEDRGFCCLFIRLSKPGPPPHNKAGSTKGQSKIPLCGGQRAMAMPWLIGPV